MPVVCSGFFTTELELPVFVVIVVNGVPIGDALVIRTCSRKLLVIVIHICAGKCSNTYHQDQDANSGFVHLDSGISRLQNFSLIYLSSNFADTEEKKYLLDTVHKWEGTRMLGS